MLTRKRLGEVRRAPRKPLLDIEGYVCRIRLAPEYFLAFRDDELVSHDLGSEAYDFQRCIGTGLP
jgi:hypothetical protein